MVLVALSVILQRERQVVDVGHLQSELVHRWGHAQGRLRHLVQRLLHRLAVHALVARPRKSVDQRSLHGRRDLSEEKYYS